MRCYSTFRSIQFDRTGYQQFLREQELNEHDIKFLNIHFVTDFTLSHFNGCVELAAGGAFFQRGREYVEQENKTTRAFYQPVHPDSKYAAIFLRPAKCHTPAHLNSVFLHETRHHIGVITFFRPVFPAKPEEIGVTACFPVKIPAQLGGLTASLPHHSAKRPSLVLL